MSLHEKIHEIDVHHRIKELDNKINCGYVILNQIKDAGQDCTDRAASIRHKIKDFEKERAELWLLANAKKVEDFLAD